MKEQKHYISLRFKGGNAFHRSGERLKLTERIINIGETADCDVRYENDCQEPEYYASIIRNDDGKSWHIVRRSQYVDISIAGRGTIGYACQLVDGDLIKFGNNPMTLSFHSHYDNHYVEGGKKQNVWQWALVAIAGMLAAIFVAIGMNGQDGISEADVLPLEESIYLVKVDSVSQIRMAGRLEDCIIQTKTLASEVPTGTAFQTTDGRIVTARHCVEFWLGRNLNLTTKVSEMPEDDIVRWAVETETYNQHQPESSDTTMTLKVWFSLYNFLGEKKYSFSSTDPRVHINREYDGIFQLADFSEDYYWRSIRPYFTDKKMSMADILWIENIAERGRVKLAEENVTRGLKRGEKLMICGYPMTGNRDRSVVFESGSIKRDVSADVENIFFESNINHGFSGGPVLVKSGNNIVAVGVVSCVDSVSSGLFKWAVPVTEIREKKGGNADEK